MDQKGWSARKQYFKNCCMRILWRLVKRPPGPRLQRFWFCRSRVRQEKFCISDKRPKCADAASSRACTLRARAVNSLRRDRGATQYSLCSATELSALSRETTRRLDALLEFARVVLNINIKNKAHYSPPPLPSCDTFYPGACSPSCKMTWTGECVRAPRRFPCSSQGVKLSSWRWHSGCTDTGKTKNADRLLRRKGEHALLCLKAKGCSWLEISRSAISMASNLKFEPMCLCSAGVRQSFHWKRKL